MLKFILLLLIFVSGCEDTKTQEDDIVKQSTNTELSKKMDREEDAPICQDLSVTKCLEIIIPALWDREVERDCG